jgi:hypothetical protein
LSVIVGLISMYVVRTMYLRTELHTNLCLILHTCKKQVEVYISKTYKYTDEILLAVIR